MSIKIDLERIKTLKVEIEEFSNDSTNSDVNPKRKRERAPTKFQANAFPTQCQQQLKAKYAMGDVHEMAKNIQALAAENTYLPTKCEDLETRQKIEDGWKVSMLGVKLFPMTTIINRHHKPVRSL